MTGAVHTMNHLEKQHRYSGKGDQGGQVTGAVHTMNHLEKQHRSSGKMRPGCPSDWCSSYSESFRETAQVLREKETRVAK